MKFLTEGPVSDYLTNLKNKATATYDYYMGKRTNKLGNLEDATAAEIRAAEPDCLKICQAFNRANAPYTVQIDRTSKKILMQFNASQTPKNLIDKFDEKKEGEYTEYIDNYDNNSGVVDLIFDVEDLPDKQEYEPDVKHQDNTKGVIGKNANKGMSRSESILKESFIIVPDSKEAYDIVKKLGFDSALEVIETQKGPAISGDNTTLSQFIKEYNNEIGEFDFIIEEAFDPFKESDTEEYTEIESKTVLDMDGLCTDYTMYRNTTTGEYVFVYGDKEIYGPEDGDFDWSCDSEKEARDWFDNYKGFTADEDDDDIKLSICPNCLGDRFSDKMGMCIDCGYDEKSHGDTGTDDLDEDILTEAPQIGEGDPAPNSVSIVDLIKGAYDKGLFNNLKCIGRENACNIDISGVDKDRLIGFFDSKEEFNREDHNEAGINSVEFISDKLDIEIFDSWMQVYKHPKNEAVKRMSAEEFVKSLEESATHCVYFSLDGGKTQEIEFEGTEDECQDYIAKLESDNEFGDEAPERFVKKLHEDTQLKLFDDDMIHDIGILMRWAPEETEKILVKYGSDPNKDTWTDGLDLPAAYDELITYFKDKYSNQEDPEIDSEVGRVLEIYESVATTPMLSISDLKVFYNNSESLKAEYPNFFAWYDAMVRAGKYKNESLSGSATQSSSVGQHKKGSIDLVPEASDDDLPEELKDALEQS